MIWVWVVAAVMLTAAAMITMFRLLAGPPSTLDRLVALDTFVAVSMCAIGTWRPSAWTPRSPTA